MERSSAKKRIIAYLALLLLTGCLLAGFTVHAQQNSATSTPNIADLPQYSGQCQASGNRIILQAPLPNVAAALNKGKTIDILTIGSSGTSQDDSYHARIKHLLEKNIKDLQITFFNRGVSGELAQETIRRFKVEVALTMPQLVLWNVGTSDAMAGTEISEFKEVVTDIVKWLKSHNVDIILIGPHFARKMSRDQDYQEIRNVIKEIALQENVMLIDRFRATRSIMRAYMSLNKLRRMNEFMLTEHSYHCLAEYIVRGFMVSMNSKNP